jgi:hypothetical protein
MRDNFWCFWDEFTTQNFRLHLRFPTLSLREMLCTQPSVRGEALSFYAFYILFFFVSLYLGCMSPGFYIFGAFLACCVLDWECFCYFWCLIGPFNFCRAPSRELQDLFTFYLWLLVFTFYSRDLESGFVDGI